MKQNSLRYSVDESPRPHITLILAVTHVLLIFDAIIFIPNVLGKSTSIDPASLQFITFAIIVVAALTTFFQSRTRWGLGSGFILFSGSYSAFLVCSLDAVNMGGLPLLATMSILTVPIVFLYTFFIRLFRHIITPAVGGVVILLVAISLVPIGLDLWTGPQGLDLAENTARMTVGAVTILALTLLMLFGTKILKLWSPLIAMACGYGSSMFFGELQFENTASAPWLGLPSLSAWPGMTFDIGLVHMPLLCAFAMAMIASAIESTGNIMLVQRISSHNFSRVNYGQVQRGLYCDGVGKVLAALMGTAVPSTYCDNLPLIEMTSVASRRVGVYGAAILLALAFIPKVGGVILDMPGPVIGGFLIVIAAMLIHAGFGLVAMTRLGNQHGLILGLSVAVGLVAESGTFFPDVISSSLSPLLQNGVAIGGFTAFLLSTLAYLSPKRGVSGVFKAELSELPRVQELLASGQAKLGLEAAEHFNVMSLCCEEVFSHIIQGDSDDPERSLTMRATKTEDGVFTEMVCGHRMDDINNFAAPDSLLLAKPDELQQLGLILFSKYARDVKHMEISGYSYISFLV